jgi:hypothetical protein
VCERVSAHARAHTHTQIHVWSWQYQKSCIYKIQWKVNLTLHFTVLQKQLAEEWYCLIQYNIFQDYGGSPTLFGVASVINHISEIFAYFFSFRLIKQIGHVKVILYSSTLYCCRNFYILCMAGPRSESLLQFTWIFGYKQDSACKPLSGELS